MSKLSIVIPCFNEEEVIEFTHARLVEVSQSFPSDQVEIVYVDDGSKDRTPALLQKFASEASGKISVIVIEFSRNFGHSAAVTAGLTYATGDSIAIMDADLQDPPELLPQMYALLSEGEGCDVVYGQRVRRERETLFKRFSAWAFYRTLNLMTGIRIPNDTGDFRILTRQVADAILRCQESDPFVRGIVAWVGFRQRAFQYARAARFAGETKYPIRKMLRFAGTAIISFSSKPLRLGLYLGAFGFLMIAGILTWALVAWMEGRTLPGWASLLAAFLIGQSFILMLLGVMGAYIGRIHDQSQDRPRFIVRREIRSRDSTSRIARAS
jgi:glycosyltransferase involved in cell wall biosynthesis